MKAPDSICADCAAVTGGHWIGDLWLYCHHSRTMARRRSGEDWTVDVGVSPRRARRHLEMAVLLMKAYCRKHNIKLEDADQVMQRLAERERGA